ncbi:MAG: transcriptional repressor [Nanoarchaeota archaeon]
MKTTRQTKQKEIISNNIEKINGFFTAEDLLKKTRTQDKRIGIATIYRFLKELKNKNQIHSYLCNRKTLFSKEKSSHCHYICEKTGKIIHFNINNIDFLKNINLPGSISSFQIEIKGICKDCKSN